MSLFRRLRSSSKNYEELDKQYMGIEALEDELTVSFSANTIYYSIDYTKTWTALSPSTTTPAINTGDRIYFKAEGLTPSSSYGIGIFTINKKCKACGNVMSLTNGTVKSYLFYKLFLNCTTLVEVSSDFLPATVLGGTCYLQMFKGCTSLVAAPKLPATTLAKYCYKLMFDGCTSLITTPELPATVLGSMCYYGMFQGCTSLVRAPELPATALTTNCYLSMFEGCTSLVNIPILSATSLAILCYLNMFKGCTSLVNASELPATVLTDSCYTSMFQDCTSLVTAPVLPATALAANCYKLMFDGCTSLIQAPKLPATTLANYCYLQMFYDCVSLVNAPELPATTLNNYCYYMMFYNCKSLVQAPVLPATTLTSNCYYMMFYGCSKLNFINAKFTTTPGSSYTLNWVNGVASSGTFIKNNQATWNVNGINGIPNGWTIKKDTDFAELTTYTEFVIDKAYDVIGNDTTTYVKYTATGTGVDYNGNAIEGTYTTTGTAYSDAFTQNTSSESITKTISITLCGMTVSTTITQGPWKNPDTAFVYIDALEDELIIGYNKPLKYLIRGESLWRLLEDKKTIPINTGERVYVLGQWLDGYSGLDGVGTFSFSKQCKVGGNINSLVNVNNTNIAEYLFRSLFKNCNKLIEVESDFLNYSKLATYCYYETFYGCTSLINTPELPATALAEHCYDSMFYGCTSLVNVPNELPATTLAEYCYYLMFLGCSNLTTSPDLLATTLAGNCCDSMFYKCSNLTTAPELPAKTLANYCYNQMFRGCTSLTTAPELPATTLADYCYDSMFRECSNLNVVFGLPALVTKQYCYANMFRDCTSLTTFRELPATALSSNCYTLMFYGCSNLTEVPELLPATTLANQCYYLMFGYTKITKAPRLPATTLVPGCYEEMFTNCSNLKHIYANFLTEPGSSYTLLWVANVSPVGTFIKNYKATWDVRGSNGIPSGWNVLENIEILSCTDLQITADNVSWSSTNTTIHYSAVCEVQQIYTQETDTITITGTAISDSFDKNMDSTDKEIVITFTYYGVTTQTTITQLSWRPTSYEINLNDQWLSSSISNPDTSLYEGVYESFSNKGVDNSEATAYITIDGYSNFKFYIRSYGESNYDYVIVSKLDLTITYNTSYNSDLVQAHTKGKSTSGTELSNYILVEFTGIDGGQHVITVLYRKDSSSSTGDDKGYLLIPKDQ